MQVAPRAPGNSQAPVKIYNAVYSSVQVYECMVRGIATKGEGRNFGEGNPAWEARDVQAVMEVSGYMDTSRERSRYCSSVWGSATVVAFVRFSANHQFPGSTAGLTPGGTASPRPLSASSSTASLNQGRAQGLFTPSTTSANMRPSGFHSPFGSQPSSSQTPPPGSSLKRNRSEADVEGPSGPYNDYAMADATSAATTPQPNGEEDPSPAKRQRLGGTPADLQPRTLNNPLNGMSRPSSTVNGANGIQPSEIVEVHKTRFATKPSIPRGVTYTRHLKIRGGLR
ncbi:hypothetical protein D9611_014630 [Ephemerocybe angulata]|uniref:Uncharacterized protein n=1 Tax=Ephemerocybe angulata TaxID=980116 RepID=A0A8H5BSA6_9AGAR|nr:hypothetical protein D9611_014630 [Tulosesus angulatus]